MVAYTTNDIKTSVEKKVLEHCTAIGVEIPDLTECFPDQGPFSGLETEHLQTQFYKENFSLIVSGCPFRFIYMHMYMYHR